MSSDVQSLRHKQRSAEHHMISDRWKQTCPHSQPTAAEPGCIHPHHGVQLLWKRHRREGKNNWETVETSEHVKTGSEPLTIRSSVTHHQVGRLTLEVTDYLLSCGHLSGRKTASRVPTPPLQGSVLSLTPLCSLSPHLGDVSLDLSDSGERSHGLQVHCHYLHLFTRLHTPS